MLPKILRSLRLVSTVKPTFAGLASTLPAGSLALTWKVWLPSLSAAVVNGDVHDAKAPASTLHSNVAVPSGELKPNVGVLSLVVEPLAGPP